MTNTQPAGPTNPTTPFAASSGGRSRVPLRAGSAIGRAAGSIGGEPSPSAARPQPIAGCVRLAVVLQPTLLPLASSRVRTARGGVVLLCLLFAACTPLTKRQPVAYPGHMAPAPVTADALARGASPSDVGVERYESFRAQIDGFQQEVITNASTLLACRAVFRGPVDRYACREVKSGDKREVGEALYRKAE